MGKLALTPLCIVGWLYAVSPAFLRFFLGKTLGRFLEFLSIRKKVICQNLEFAFPGSSPENQATRSRLLSDAYVHLGYLFFEICMVMGPASAMKWFVKNRIDFKGLEIWKKAFDQGKGVIFLSSHVGCWEIMAASGGVRGIEVVIVTKRIKPSWLHDWIEKGRKQCSVEGAYEPKTLSKVLKQLEKKKTVGFVLDQYAGAPIGVRVPLFGIPVGTATVVAAVARRTQSPVLPVVNYRLPNGRIRVEIQPPIEFEKLPESPREVAHNTARYVKVLEKHILAHPDQWLWIHRRFKGDLSPLRTEDWDGRRTSARQGPGSKLN